MHKLLTLLALFAAASVSGAQTRTAIEAAKRTAAAANSRNDSSASAQAQIAGGRTVASSAGADQKPGTIDSAAKMADSANMPKPAARKAVPAITREIYSYDGGERRDPFLSLARSGALRPHITELTIHGIIDGGSSRAVAILLDKTTKDQYRIKVGNTVGRYRVVKIDAKSVIFAIEEFGLSRQEVLFIGDTTKVRGQ